MLATTVSNALIRARWHDGKTTDHPVMFNPTELQLEKGTQLAEIGIPGLDAPLQQFVRGQAEKLTVELFFDTTDAGMGKKATSVTTETDAFYQLVKIEPRGHAPPIVTFLWNSHFPGDQLKDATGNQLRNSFTGVAESISQRFTLFNPEGVPLRARLNLTLREYRPLEEQLQQLGRSSPDKTHAHVVKAGDRLSALAGTYYRRPGAWRAIATANGIEDPRRLAVGSALEVPKIS